MVSMMRDLKNSRWIYFKAGLFLAIGLLSAGMLIGQDPTLKTIVLVALTIWSFARLYYFAFYVIERYVDPSYHFAGLGSAFRYLMGGMSRHQRRQNNSH
jgi:prolipoprotein diacylglyceryltransferase